MLGSVHNVNVDRKNVPTWVQHIINVIWGLSLSRMIAKLDGKQRAKHTKNTNNGN